MEIVCIPLTDIVSCSEAKSEWCLSYYFETLEHSSAILVVT